MSDITKLSTKELLTQYETIEDELVERAESLHNLLKTLDFKWFDKKSKYTKDLEKYYSVTWSSELGFCIIDRYDHDFETDIPIHWLDLLEPSNHTQLVQEFTSRYEEARKQYLLDAKQQQIKKEKRERALLQHLMDKYKE